ncbi:MAG: 5'/3'-nucleotidase SurE [Myxococcales bacterium]|nr:5'/3'-nucleotidase SurE [Myxococcales bacterium]
MLTALADRLAALGDVLVVAPERPRSAASHAITLHKPVRARELTPGRWSLSGTPADCVYVGLLRLAPRPPDIVVSGPNDGYNLGSDVYYSGTVAGAVEGALRGHRGVALSMAPRASTLATALEFAAGLVAAALVDLAPGEVVNVNIPGAGERRYAWTTLGKRRYQNDVTEREDPYGRPYYWIGGGSLGHEDVPGSDCNAIADGLASVTPLQIDWSHRARVATPPFVIAGFDPA